MSDTGIRSETDRFIMNGNASRRKGCAPTRTSVKGTTVPISSKKNRHNKRFKIKESENMNSQKETDTNRYTTAMLNRCTNVRAGGINR